MTLRAVQRLCTTDLLLCEKTHGDYKYSKGEDGKALGPGDLVGFCNTYGYLFPRDSDIPHMPHKSPPKLEDGEGWDAWVQILCLARGKAIIRAKFGEGEVNLPDKRRRSDFSWVGNGTTSFAIMELSHQEWKRQQKDKRQYPFLQVCGTLSLHPVEAKGFGTIITVGVRDTGDGFLPVIERISGRTVPDPLCLQLTEILQDAIPWEKQTEIREVFLYIQGWAEAAAPNLLQAYREQGFGV